MYERLYLPPSLLLSVHLGLTLPLAIVAICYKKCRVAINISHWLKVNSRWFEKYISAKKCILISYYCAIHVFNFLNAGFFSI